MEKLIKFRLLSDSLSTNEFTQFLNQLFAQFDKRNLILKSLVYLFHAEIEKNGTNSDLITTINIISKIIQSRDNNKSNNTNNSTSFPLIQKPKQESNKKKTASFHNLPTELIRHCTSYLTFDEYQSLQIVSRSIFIGCNNPINIQYIDRMIFSKCYYNYLYHSKLTKFTKLKHIEINVQEFINMPVLHSTFTSSKLSNLKTLCLFSSYSSSIKQFLDIENIKYLLSNISTLKLNGFYKRFGASFNIEQHCQLFIDLFKSTPNLEYLELNGLSVTDSMNDDKFMHIFDDQVLSDTFYILFI